MPAPDLDRIELFISHASEDKDELVTNHYVLSPEERYELASQAAGIRMRFDEDTAD